MGYAQIGEIEHNITYSHHAYHDPALPRAALCGLEWTRDYVQYESGFSHPVPIRSAPLKPIWGKDLRCEPDQALTVAATT